MMQELNRSLRKLKQHKMEAEIYTRSMNVSVHFYI